MGYEPKRRTLYLVFSFFRAFFFLFSFDLGFFAGFFPLFLTRLLTFLLNAACVIAWISLLVSDLTFYTRELYAHAHAHAQTVQYLDHGFKRSPNEAGTDILVRRPMLVPLVFL